MLALQKENRQLRQTLLLSSGLRQRFEELYDTSPVGLLSLNAKNQITEANLTFAQILNTKRPALIGQPLATLIAADDLTTFVQHLKRVREQVADSPTPDHCTLHLMNTGSHSTEVRIESVLASDASPEPSTIRITVFPIGDENNATPQCHTELALINLQLQKEISERELAEEKMRQHQEDLAHVDRLSTVDEMASGLAHEINQPLTAIVSYTQSCLRLLRGDEQKQAQVPNILEQVNAQAQRAASIIKHLRDFVAKGKSRRETADLSSIVQLAVSMIRNEIIDQQIALSIDTPSALPPIKADPIQIEQVILNLLRNATEAMSDVAANSRKLFITMGRFSPTHLFIAIEDTGPGIHADNSDRLFTPFFSTKETGMGLGLAISRSIVEDHGGQLTHATNDNGGVTFTFTLAIDGTHTVSG